MIKFINGNCSYLYNMNDVNINKKQVVSIMEINYKNLGSKMRDGLRNRINNITKYYITCKRKLN